MSSNDQAKRAAAEAAYEFLIEDDYIGIGTGSTVNHFIDVMAERKPSIRACVSSSEATSAKLKKAGFEIEELNYTGNLPVYFDGADEINTHFEMIKGGGGALTREKIIASVSRRFVCMVDESKRVDILGNFPLPVEVIEMGRSAVARQLVKLGGSPELRPNVRSDNGNPILDVYNLDLSNAIAMEDKINAIPGVVTVGLFARRPADVLIVGSDHGVETLTRKP
ncbi:ribose-5-phosphate isomerase RpiA [Salinisphaera hydrothermalis]|uniref:ribose-5-phosphate isomerase RpiA n=1 Tax=Salinisphaera hydrothermalis TaxID=563188 RepID=UPI0033408F74